MRIGVSEICIIVLIGFALLKPDKLHKYSKGFGRALRSLMGEVRDIKTDADYLLEPIQQVQEDANVCMEEIRSVIKEEGDK